MELKIYIKNINTNNKYIYYFPSKARMPSKDGLPILNFEDYIRNIFKFILKIHLKIL